MTSLKRSKLRTAPLPPLPCFESLEARQLFTTWNWNATLIHQDQATADFPSLTGAGESVVVIDTGADPNHPSFSGKNIIWKDFFGTSTTPVDTDGHGTGVAGILAGNAFTYSGDGTHGQGIVPGAQLIVLRADSGATKAWAPQAARISAALDWVAANQATYNIVAVNISLGSNQNFSDTALTGDKNLAIDQQLETKFANLAAAGIFVGSAAGNSGATAPDTIDYPAADPNVISTSSVDSDGAVSSFSSRGALNDLLAPGDNIVAPYDFPGNPSLAGTYYVNYATGTSFASPQVVGAAALIKQINPNFTPAQILQILEDSGTPVFDPVTGHTFPLLNLDAALKLAVADADPLSNHAGASAASIALSNGQGSLDNQILLGGVPNFYSFTVGATSNVTVNVGYGGGESATATLLTAGGGTIANIPVGGATQQLTAGTYYILVASQSALGNPYTVSVSASAVVPPSPVIPPAFPGVGAGNAKIAYDPYGRLDMAWYDASAKTLDFAMRNADGTWNAATTVDASPQAGTQLSIAVDPYGLPGIAYYDAGYGRLKYAHFNGSTWNISVVDSSGITGWQPSLVYTNAAAPYIAYFVASTLDLRVAALNGTKWSVTTVDSKGNVGFIPSIAYDKVTGVIGVAYQDLTHSWYKYASTTGRGWKLSVVDTTTHAAGGSLSLAFDANHLPAMAYNDAYTLAMVYAHSNGVTWSTQRVAGSAFGMAANLSFDNTGAADILYYNYYAGDIEHANLSGGLWSNTSITAGGALLDEARGSQGQKTISWIAGGAVQIADL